MHGGGVANYGRFIRCSRHSNPNWRWLSISRNSSFSQSSADLQYLHLSEVTDLPHDSHGSLEEMAPKYDRIPSPESGKLLPAIGNPLNLAGWPDSPQRLKRQSLISMIGDIVFCIIPLTFAAVGLICIKINGTTVSDLGMRLQQIILLVLVLGLPCESQDGCKLI
jgi:hypothetical protein